LPFNEIVSPTRATCCPESDVGADEPDVGSWVDAVLTVCVGEHPAERRTNTLKDRPTTK
jgi:hypothetical protein